MKPDTKTALAERAKGVATTARRWQATWKIPRLSRAYSWPLPSTLTPSG